MARLAQNSFSPLGDNDKLELLHSSSCPEGWLVILQIDFCCVDPGPSLDCSDIPCISYRRPSLAVGANPKVPGA